MAGTGMIRKDIRSAGILALFLLFIACGTASGADITAAIGDTVHLTGYSSGSSVVYLFLTGPNLPVNGVALDDVTRPADQGWVTRVEVDNNNHWKYDWHTGSAGGRLDQGTYTVWITTERTDLSHLRSGEFGTLSVRLGSPGLSRGVTAQVVSSQSGSSQPGAIEVRSVPDGASVTVDGQYRGQTPLTIEGVSPGTYTVAISHFRFRPVTESVTVRSGETTAVNETLAPYTGSLSVASSPPGARILLDGSDAGTAPRTISDIAAGNHTVSLQLPGYATAEAPVVVVTDETANISLALTPEKGAGTPAATAAGDPVAGTCVVSAAALLLAITIFRCRKG